LRVVPGAVQIGSQAAQQVSGCPLLIRRPVEERQRPLRLDVYLLIAEERRRLLRKRANLPVMPEGGE
jgi:hypothetical protein